MQLRYGPHPAPDARGDAGGLAGDARRLPVSQTTPSPSPSRMNGYAGWSRVTGAIPCDLAGPDGSGGHGGRHAQDVCPVPVDQVRVACTRAGAFPYNQQEDRPSVQVTRSFSAARLSTMIEVHHDTLHFSFHDVHADAHFRLSFQRTLRIPDDNRSYPLPPGLGDFPLYRVDDHAARLPPAWREHGGVFLPIAQSEAMWLSFSGSYPMALRIASGKIDAVTGELWSDGLTEEPQNYVVVPEQPWLDGFCVAKGSIRQFVAMPLGTGYTAEEQLTGEAVHGGLQVGVHPMKRNAYLEYRSSSVFENTGVCYSPPADKSSREMGLAPGGLMKQELAADPHDFDVWEPHALARCFVHILNAKQFFEVTGARPPEPPPTAASYTEAGLPWFEYYGGDVEALAAAPALAELDSVAAMTIKQGDGVLPDNDPVTPRLVRPVGPAAHAVREGRF